MWTAYIQTKDEVERIGNYDSCDLALEAARHAAPLMVDGRKWTAVALPAGSRPPSVDVRRETMNIANGVERRDRAKFFAQKFFVERARHAWEMRQRKKLEGRISDAIK